MISNRPIGMIPFSIEKQGSTFLRINGVVANSDNFEVWRHGVKYDSIILQKVLWREMMEYFEGPKILDVCDPDWLSGNRKFVDIASLADAITCSSPALTNYVKQLFPQKIVSHIPDRLNFKLFTQPKPIHVGKAKKIAWFGYMHNAHETLKVMIPIIKEYNLELTFISNKPFELTDQIEGIETNFIEYSTNTAYEHLRNVDIIINPKSTHPAFRYKSNNKTITGWKLGIPVAETAEELIKFIDADARNLEIMQKGPLVEAQYNVVDSVKEYNDIINLIKGH